MNNTLQEIAENKYPIDRGDMPKALAERKAFISGMEQSGVAGLVEALEKYIKFLEDAYKYAYIMAYVHHYRESQEKIDLGTELRKQINDATEALSSFKEGNEMLSNVFDEIKQERIRQDAKWGEQNHSPNDWLMILGEEFGEVCKAALEAKFGKGTLREYRNELIQVAAVSIAMIECFDRNDINPQK